MTGERTRKRGTATGRTPSEPVDGAQRVAQEVFGHGSFQPGQEEAMEALLDGHDVLLVAPTGAGKSLAYQVPALLIEGCTVVVSPLLALQQDQLRSLGEGEGPTRGVRVSSAESPAQQAHALDAVARGTAEFLFLAPEQLAREEVRARVAELRPSLVAVDEAHCVSTWGHDFRPDYFRLGELIDRVGRPRVIALTATAAPPVREDIVSRLRLRDPRTVVVGFGRDNIRIAVRRCLEAEDQRDSVVEAVRRTPGPGIVYCRTRRATEEYAAALAAEGRSVACYHAGLGQRRRREAHDRFLEGGAEVMVATSAFGMGIDKPDIRFVFHAQVPESVDTYYQEVGRAGRDGEPASAVLFYRPEDLALGRFFTSAPPKAEDVAAVVEASSEGQPPTAKALARTTGLSARRVGRILNLVDEVERSSDDRAHGADLVGAVVARAEDHRLLERSRVEMMRAYAETDRCRWEFVLGYFGEPGGPCGHCDTCEAGVGEESADGDVDYPPQARVHHPEFGEGMVMDVEHDKITVLFDGPGYRTLDLGLVRERQLLTPVGRTTRGERRR